MNNEEHQNRLTELCQKGKQGTHHDNHEQLRKPTQTKRTRTVHED